MITREEKNKEYDNEIQKEKAINISKKIFHVISVILIILFLLFAYIYFIGIKGLKVNEFVIKNQSIPESFHGVKILHFTDLLYGSTIFKDEIDNLEKQINLINPDIVVFTGNVISKEYKITEDEINFLNKFFKDIPYTIGKYAVKGENDSSTSFHLIMENTGFNVLENEMVDVYNNSLESLKIIGLDIIDDEVISDDSYKITLINNYDNYEKFHLKSDIVLGGYNLGGEIRLFNYPLIGDSKYNNRYYEENNSKVYLSSGLGSVHHMRFMNHPSINVYRLYAK